jgi:hypothetical protein
MGDIEKLEEELDNIPVDYIVLIETTAEKAFEVSVAVAKWLTNMRDSGIIVSANRPYSNLISILNKNGVNLSKLFILDCVSKNLNGEVEADNVLFLENLSSLTDISLSISEHLKKVNGNKKFVFFDSVTTMLIHNKPYIFARFVHNILTRMRLKGVGGILVSLKDKTNKEIRAEIAQLCDKVIQI